MPPPVTSSYARAGDFRIPGQRGFTFTVQIDMGSIPTLPERMEGHLHEALIFHFKDVAERVIETARSYLVRLEDPAIKESFDGIGIHGFDTGAMSAGFRDVLMEDLLDIGIFYSLFSDVPYWQYVEFGHWTRGGNFWPGYHMLETAVIENAGAIRQAAREAWSDTAMALAMEARVPGAIGRIGLNLP